MSPCSILLGSPRMTKFPTDVLVLGAKQRQIKSAKRVEAQAKL
jgi:hypothetical protein